MDDPRTGRSALVERAAIGLAHEGKNPLHTMALHLHLLSEKIAKLGPPDPAIERHTGALRDGIARVDGLLRAFGDLAVPSHVEPDLAEGYARAALLFGYELRRSGGQVAVWNGPRSVRVEAPGPALADALTHAFLAAAVMARGGGTVSAEVREDDSSAEIVIKSEGGMGGPEEAAPYLDALSQQALELKADLSIAASAAGSARLSISLPRAR